MCGINGFNFIDKKIIKAMNESIKHRGPDAEGTFFEENLAVSLGHQRLSILDLSSAGKQPMFYNHKGKKLAIVFNGEIYNFEELKKELQKKGYTFKSKCDTEVILASYLNWGEKCVEKFNGMWAFCLLDFNKKIFFLSRDRLGVKPLYYYFDKNKFIFSSQVKAILKHKLKIKLNPEAVDLYFSLGFIPSPYSIYSNIFKINPGENLVFDLRKKVLQKNFYFNPPSYSPIKDKKLLKKNLLELLKDSTKLRMISDVPLGAFLSGGIDSSSIVSQMKSFTDNLNTFSIGFEGKYDESPYIKLATKKFQTNHSHKYFYQNEFEEQLKKIFFYYDEPLADPSLFPTFSLSELARTKLTVSLTGDGGDEIFGGYPRHQKARKIAILKRIPKFIRKLIHFLTPVKSIKQGLEVSFLEPYEIFSKSRPEIYKPKIFQDLSEKKMKYCLLLSKNDLVEATILYDRYFNTLPDNYLTKVDRASMAVSLEARSPFLDYRFLEFSSKIPSNLKVSSSKTKILFKKAIKKLIPKKILKRKKAGFTPPIEKWILQEKYLNEIKKDLNLLNKLGIISDSWKEFYQNQVFENTQNKIYQNYLIRFFFFSKWFKFWKPNF